MITKKIYSLLAFWLVWSMSISLYAQVTIGAGTKPSSFSVLELSTAGTKGGLRMPHLSTTERDALNFANLPSGTPAQQATKAQAVGLSIYNTDTKCVEYWNSTKWVSLCTGNADIGFKDEQGNNADPTSPEFSENGEEKGPFLPQESPLCTGTRPPYSYAAMTGADFIHIEVVDESTGKFTVRMDENPTARSRNAIVRVTNNCSGEYKEFLFSQKGNDGQCTPAIAKPTIAHSNKLELCKDGAVFLWITNANAAATYIWTLNEVEQGRGTSYTATRSGRYIVYVGSIGCPANSSEQLVIINNNNTAPEPTKIRANNGATICGTTPVALTATYIGTATDIYWYKDGVYTGSRGASYTANAEGSYFAVISQGDCTSRASNTIDVGKNATGSSIVGFDLSTVYVNSIPLTGAPVFCKGGLLNLEVNPADHDLTYTWKINDVEVGKGYKLAHTLSSSATGDLYLEVIASKAGDAFTCPTSVEFKKTIKEEPLPNAIILGDAQFCGGKSAQLNTATGGTSYLWKNLTTNGTAITSTNSYQATTPGDYRVEITTGGGCVASSPQDYTVDRWGVPVLQWSTAVSKVGENKEFPLSVYNTSTDATGFTWTIDPAAHGTIKSSNLTDAVISLSDDATIKVFATNICGNGPLLSLPIEVEKVRPANPIVNNAGATTYCGGFTYNVTNLASYGANVDFTWSVTSGTAILKPMGDKKESCYIEFMGAGAVTIQVIATEGLPSLPTVATVNGNVKTSNAYTLSGVWCYDVKLTDYAPAVEWGIWAHRTKEDFTQVKKYKLIGSPLPTASNIKWTVKDPHSAIQAGGFVPNVSSPGEVSIKFRENLPQQLKGNKTGITVKLEVSWTVNEGGCISTYYDEKFIVIKDADCCSGVTDADGVFYNTAQFGDAGCWMTENLRTKKTPSKTLTLTTDYRIPGGNEAVANANNYGYHYTWAAAVDFNANGFETVPVGQAGKNKSTLRGICPDGWVLPSDFDWNMLEKEIATSPSEYSSETTPRTWNTNWEREEGWRPTGHQDVEGWCYNMLRTSTAGSVNPTNGKSNNTAEGGFDLPTSGYGGQIGKSPILLTSSKANQNEGRTRYFHGNIDAVYRYNIPITEPFGGVRCKKKD